MLVDGYPFNYHPMKQPGYLTFEEKKKGSLEPGKLADFIVIDSDVQTCPVEDVKDAVVLNTYLGGKRIHVAESE